MSLLIKNIQTIFQTEEQPTKTKKGAEMASVNSIHQGYIACKNDLIEDFGPMKSCPDEQRFDEVLDAAGKFVLPAFVDSHTHIVFAKSREEEFVMKIQGKSYEEIAAAGGGILNSAAKIAEASEDELYERAWNRLMNVISYGTGAIEIKSGYGLSVESEIKMLRVIKRLKEKSPIPVKANFLGAHAYPLNYKQDHPGYLKMITEEMLPIIAREGLADYIDAFCENGFFSPEETEVVLKAGEKYGLKPKIHANQLAISGGVQTGVKNAAISVDHLEEVGEAEIKCLQESDTIPTLLPSCSFYLGIPFAPARKLIEAGLPVCLASDYNPGSTPSGNMQFVMSLACIKMKLLPEEALNAMTINAAAALEMQNELGTITKGKRANLILTKSIPSLAYIPYSFGENCVDKMILDGKVFRNV